MNHEKIMTSNCQSLYILSTIACQPAECLNEEKLEVLSADLKNLGEMLKSLIARKAKCGDD